jgi:hypothetical protein
MYSVVNDFEKLKIEILKLSQSKSWFKSAQKHTPIPQKSASVSSVNSSVPQRLSKEENASKKRIGKLKNPRAPWKRDVRPRIELPAESVLPLMAMPNELSFDKVETTVEIMLPLKAMPNELSIDQVDHMSPLQAMPIEL